MHIWLLPYFRFCIFLHLTWTPHISNIFFPVLWFSRFFNSASCALGKPVLKPYPYEPHFFCRYSPTPPPIETPPQQPEESDFNRDLITACSRFLSYFCRVSRRNQMASFDHISYFLEQSDIGLCKCLQGSEWQLKLPNQIALQEFTANKSGLTEQSSCLRTVRGSWFLFFGWFSPLTLDACLGWIHVRTHSIILTEHINLRSRICWWLRLIYVALVRNTKREGYFFIYFDIMYKG